MPEDSLVSYVFSGMRRYWEKPVKHADAYTPGIADISAWLAPVGNIGVDLKAAREWPKRADTPITFSDEEHWLLQRQFLLARRGWVLARVENEYLLFDHETAARVIDTPLATRGYLHGVAKKVWFRKIIWKEFAQCIGKRCA